MDGTEVAEVRWALSAGGGDDRSLAVVSRSVGVVDLVGSEGATVALLVLILAAVVYAVALSWPAGSMVVAWALLLGTGFLYAAGWIALGLAIVLPLGWLFERWRASRL